MTSDINRNGKRPTHSIPQPHHHSTRPNHSGNLDQERIPLDPLIINHSSKRIKTQNKNQTHNQNHPIDHHSSQKRPSIKKSLSGLIFPRSLSFNHHQNQNHHQIHNTPLDLLNPITTSNHLNHSNLVNQAHPSPTLKKPQILLKQHQSPNPIHLSNLNQNSIKDPRLVIREKQRNKEELKKEIAQWQEKYRLAIKSFVFYLDRLDPQIEIDLSNKIQSWGARIDPFFSRDVTHVITDQPVPANIPIASPTATHLSKRNSTSAYQLPLINPSPLRNKENGQLVITRRTSKRLNGAHTPEKISQPVESTPSIDPLIRKALELKMKIWKSEKLLNVLCRLEDHKSPVKLNSLIKPSLPSLLLKEAQQGHTHEHDPVAIRLDYYYFPSKSMFIMVEDAIQEFKPIIVKEYPRPKTREAISWPVMWGGTEGKSAFSRYTAKQSYLPVRNRIRSMFELRAREIESSKPKLVPSETNKIFKSPELTTRQMPIDSVIPPQHNLRRATSMNILQRRQSARLLRTSLSRKIVESTEIDDDDADVGEIDHVNTTAPNYHRGPGKEFLAASGNSVSMTSNVASVPSTRSSAFRTGSIGRQLVDKRLTALGKRPTFEMTPQNPLVGGSSLKQEIGLVETFQNNSTISQKDSEKSKKSNLKRCQSLDGAMMAKKKQLDKRFHSGRKGLGVRAKLGNGYDLLDLRRLAKVEEPKAGYCENCRIKYSDFRKHILTRRHRKFALDDVYWIELDDMLKRTTRRLKPNVQVPPSVREMIMLCDEKDDEDEDEDEDEDDDEEEEEEEGEEEEECDVDEFDYDEREEEEEEEDDDDDVDDDEGNLEDVEDQQDKKENEELCGVDEDDDGGNEEEEEMLNCELDENKYQGKKEEDILDSNTAIIQGLKLPPKQFEHDVLIFEKQTFQMQNSPKIMTNHPAGLENQPHHLDEHIEHDLPNRLSEEFDEINQKIEESTDVSNIKSKPEGQHESKQTQPPVQSTVEHDSKQFVEAMRHELENDGNNEDDDQMARSEVCSEKDDNCAKEELEEGECSGEYSIIKNDFPTLTVELEEGECDESELTTHHSQQHRLTDGGGSAMDFYSYDYQANQPIRFELYPRPPQQSCHVGLHFSGSAGSTGVGGMGSSCAPTHIYDIPSSSYLPFPVQVPVPAPQQRHQKQEQGQMRDFWMTTT